MRIDTTALIKQVVYPESDGQPIADNTKQFRWIMTIKGNLDVLFADRPDVFVAGDLLWYPVEGNPAIRRAPDAMVVFGRPKGDRGSYLQWQEEYLAPQVVFEVLSPGNTLAEMARKFEFYTRYGVEEYYIYNSDTNDLSGWRRYEQALALIDPVDDWISLRLGIRFTLGMETLHIFYPDGRPFLDFVELNQRAEAAEQRAESAEQRVERLAAQLRAMGIDPTA